MRFHGRAVFTASYKDCVTAESIPAVIKPRLAIVEVFAALPWIGCASGGAPVSAYAHELVPMIGTETLDRADSMDTKLISQCRQWPLEAPPLHQICTKLHRFSSSLSSQ